MKTYWLLGKALPDGVRDPCEIGKEDVAKNGGRSRSSSLADSPILRRYAYVELIIHISFLFMSGTEREVGG